MASRWTTALVDPPIAALTRIAFSNAALVMIWAGVTSCSTRSTMTCPARWAVSYRRESTAGQDAEYGSCMPSASAIDAIVDAVPIVMQCPSDRDMHPSANAHSSCVIRPASRSSSQRHTAVPEPTSVPWYLPFSFGPPVTMIAGRPTLEAAISRPGVVLSQPDSSTTPSSGLARISSSASMASRLRYSIAVGRSSVSPRAIAGNSSGKPPACHTPRLTDSATRCRWTLHGASSDHVVAIPITGRPSNTSDVNPWLRIHDRWFIPARPVAANHAALRLLVVMVLMYVMPGPKSEVASSRRQ